MKTTDNCSIGGLHSMFADNHGRVFAAMMMMIMMLGTKQSRLPNRWKSASSAPAVSSGLGWAAQSRPVTTGKSWRHGCRTPAHRWRCTHAPPSPVTGDVGFSSPAGPWKMYCVVIINNNIIDWSDWETISAHGPWIIQTEMKLHGGHLKNTPELQNRWVGPLALHCVPCYRPQPTPP